MGITSRQIIQDILNIASSGVVPVSTRLSERQIFLWVNECRATLISQSIARRDDILDSCIQTIGNVELELVDKSEATDLPIDCYLLKSTLQIPRTIDTSKDNSVLSVTGLDGTPITKSNSFRAKYKKYSKFTSKQAAWYIKNDYLYVVNSQGNMLSNVSVVGLFENPEDINAFLGTNDEIFTWESSYPVSNKIASEITNIVIKTKIIPLLQAPVDTTNNDNNLPNGITTNK